MKRKNKNNLRVLQPVNSISVNHSVTPQPLKIPFEQWWLLAKTQKKLPESLKESLKYHFIARGFWKTQDWEVGLRDFGY